MGAWGSFSERRLAGWSVCLLSPPVLALSTGLNWLPPCPSAVPGAENTNRKFTLSSKEGDQDRVGLAVGLGAHSGGWGELAYPGAG